MKKRYINYKDIPSYIVHEKCKECGERFKDTFNPHLSEDNTCWVCIEEDRASQVDRNEEHADFLYNYYDFK